MTPSKEFLALVAARKPDSDQPGDLWLQRDCGIIICFTAHKRGQRKRGALTSFTLYHWKQPDLLARPANFRDYDMNSHGFDPHMPMPGVGIVGGGKRWEYIGNLFSMLPYDVLLARCDP